jgi:predicted small lipoprotein YifL
MAARRCLVALAAAALLPGCGSGGPDYSLKTPPAASVAGPIETPVAKRAKPKARAGERHPTQRDAERLRPVLEGWAAAVRADNPHRAARFFAIPAIVAQSMTVELQTREQVVRFNDELPCGARLLEVQHEGRYVVGTFRLTERAGRPCAAAGQLVRVAFVIRSRHFTEWRQVPDRPGAPPGPDEPEEAPPPGGPGAA